MRTLEIVIRNALYTFAFIMATVALTLMATSILPSLMNLRNGFAAFALLGVVTTTAPLALALAVVPLCLAVAFDRLTNP